MRGTILITGFGPFPGAPFNPTQELVKTLARRRRPGIRVISHIFPTRYAAVDHDLPALIARHRPDALLMFGLHGRARTLRVETLARNALSRHADAGGSRPAGWAIAPAGPRQLPLPVTARRLLQAVRQSGGRAVLSRDAGSYLCNYLCWRAAEAAAAGGPRLTAFVHVPPVMRKAMPRRSAGRRLLTPRNLARAGEFLLATVAACLGSAGKRP